MDGAGDGGHAQQVGIAFYRVNSRQDMNLVMDFRHPCLHLCLPYRPMTIFGVCLDLEWYCDLNRAVHPSVGVDGVGNVQDVVAGVVVDHHEDRDIRDRVNLDHYHCDCHSSRLDRENGQGDQGVMDDHHLRWNLFRNLWSLERKVNR